MYTGIQKLFLLGIALLLSGCFAANVDSFAAKIQKDPKPNSEVYKPKAYTVFETNNLNYSDDIRYNEAFGDYIIYSGSIKGINSLILTDHTGSFHENIGAYNTPVFPVENSDKIMIGNEYDDFVIYDISEKETTDFSVPITPGGGNTMENLQATNDGSSIIFFGNIDSSASTEIYKLELLTRNLTKLSNGSEVFLQKIFKWLDDDIHFIVLNNSMDLVKINSMTGTRTVISASIDNVFGERKNSGLSYLVIKDSKIYYAKTVGGFSGVYRNSLDGLNEERLSPAGQSHVASCMSISQDGQRLATCGKLGGDTKAEAYVMNIDGSNMVKQNSVSTSGSYGVIQVVSLANDSIYYMGDFNGANRYAAYIDTFNSSNVRQSHRTIESSSAVTWGPAFKMQVLTAESKVLFTESDGDKFTYDFYGDNKTTYVSSSGLPSDAVLMGEHLGIKYYKNASEIYRHNSGDDSYTKLIDSATMGLGAWGSSYNGLKTIFSNGKISIPFNTYEGMDSQENSRRHRLVVYDLVTQEWAIVNHSDAYNMDPKKYVAKFSDLDNGIYNLNSSNSATASPLSIPLNSGETHLWMEDLFGLKLVFNSDEAFLYDSATASKKVTLGSYSNLLRPFTLNSSGNCAFASGVWSQAEMAFIKESSGVYTYSQFSLASGRFDSGASYTDNGYRFDEACEKVYYHERTADLIYKANLDGTNIVQLTAPFPSGGDAKLIELIEEPGFNKVIYLAAPDVSSQFGLYSMDLDGSNVQELSSRAANSLANVQLAGYLTRDYSSPVFESDSKKIVYTSNEFDNSIRTIIAVNADGTGKTNLSPNITATDSIQNYDVRKDGVLAVYTDASSKKHLYFSSYDGSRQKVFDFDTLSGNSGPFWAMGANKIMGPKDFKYRLVSVNRESGKADELFVLNLLELEKQSVSGPLEDGFKLGSADMTEKHIVYTVHSANESRVYLYDLKTKDQVLLTDKDNPPFSASVSVHISENAKYVSFYETRQDKKTYFMKHQILPD